MPADRSVPAGEAARSLFSKFRSLLEANTAALATMAAMERMLGGEFIFDRAYLEKAAREVADFAHQAVYALNSMTGNRHVALYDRFMCVQTAVEDILAGRPSVDDDRLIRPLSDLRLEDRLKVGEGAAALGELAGQLGLPVPRGMAVAAAAFADGHLTAAGREAVTAALGDPQRGPGSAMVTLAVQGLTAAGAADTPHIREVPSRAEAVLAALDDLAEAAFGADGVAALLLARPEVTLQARLRTHWREGTGAPLLRLDAWTGDDPEQGDTFFLDRSHPFAVRRSRIALKDLDYRMPDGAAPLDPGAEGWLRGSALLLRDTAAMLAGQAMACERLLGGAVDLAVWRDGSGAFLLHGVLLAAQDTAGPAADPCPGEVLLSGGEAACLGLVSGAVVQVDETTAPETFPYGAVAVTRSASPALAPLLRRVGALVAEVGDATGHLAAVAREYRTPALFGLPGARDALPEGMVVTVDAETGRICRGATVLPPATTSGLCPDDPEYLLLRRLLRRIATLTLTDPQAPEFTPEGCRTLHDILHFAHDRAVAVLADLRQVGVSGHHLARPLILPVPLDLRVLDIGGGLVAGATGLAAVRSRPLRALLAGVLDPGLWDAAPARLGLGDLLGAMATGPETDTGGNLAIAARSYCNVSLRLGYHFTVIDAYLGQNPEKNTIYFRFVGGMAGAAGRRARAAFMQHVLVHHDFKVEVAGDLVVARLKFIEPETAEAALRLLGRLCAFARQRDTGDPDPGQLEAAFLDAIRALDAPAGVAP